MRSDYQKGGRGRKSSQCPAGPVLLGGGAHRHLPSPYPGGEAGVPPHPAGSVLMGIGGGQVFVSISVSVTHASTGCATGKPEGGKEGASSFLTSLSSSEVSS